MLSCPCGRMSVSDVDEMRLLAFSATLIQRHFRLYSAKNLILVHLLEVKLKPLWQTLLQNHPEQPDRVDMTLRQIRFCVHHTLCAWRRSCKFCIADKLPGLQPNMAFMLTSFSNDISVDLWQTDFHNLDLHSSAGDAISATCGCFVLLSKVRTRFGQNRKKWLKRLGRPKRKPVRRSQ